MHVADGHGPVLDIPGQLLHWQLPKRARQSMQSAGGVHGLSAQIGALRQLLCSNGLELSHEKYILRCAITWPSWHGRRSRMNVDGAR